MDATSYAVQRVHCSFSAAVVAIALVSVSAGCQPTPPHGPGCLEPAAVNGTPIARVGDVVITAERIEARLKAQGISRHQYESSKGLRDLVEDEVRFELLAKAALDRGLARDPDVIDAARRVMVRKLLQRDLDPAVFEATLGDEALRVYYERHRDGYMQPEKRRFAHIQLAPTEDGRLLAQNLIDKLQKRPDAEFNAAASKYSLDSSSRLHGGDQPFETRDDITDAFGLSFANAVFSLEPNTVAPQPVQSTRGWHVLKMIARREALARDFAEVREQIRERLMQGQRSKQFQSYLEEVRQTYPVAIYDDRLQTIVRDWAGKGP